MVSQIMAPFSVMLVTLVQDAIRRPRTGRQRWRALWGGGDGNTIQSVPHQPLCLTLGRWKPSGNVDAKMAMDWVHTSKLKYDSTSRKNNHNETVTLTMSKIRFPRTVLSADDIGRPSEEDLP